MSLEHPSLSRKESQRPAELAAGFRNLHSPEAEVFTDLESALASEDFSQATAETVASVFSNNSFLCRSENFTQVMDLLLEGHAIELRNEDHAANMCIMASGEGFKIAMTEGFGGKDVGETVKTVVTFRGDHLMSRDAIASEEELWKTKPKTAQVSCAGKGTVTLEDIAMISFRFPVHLFPPTLLTETEQEQLEEAGIKFIVRHYVPDNKKTIH